MSRPSRVARAGLAAGAMVALALGSAAPAQGAPEGQPVVLADRLGLAAQTPFDLPADGTVSLVLELPPALRAGSPDATLVVTAYRPLVTRLEVVEALEGELGRSGDSVDIDLATLPPLSGDQFTISIATETSARTVEALQLPQPGLYPVLVEWYDGGEVLARRDLGDDAAEDAVHVLREDHERLEPRGVRRTGHHRGRGLIARALEREQPCHWGSPRRGASQGPSGQGVRRAAARRGVARGTRCWSRSTSRPRR